jgi:hypothetical protein
VGLDYRHANHAAQARPRKKLALLDVPHAKQASSVRRMRQPVIFALKVSRALRAHKRVNHAEQVLLLHKQALHAALRALLDRTHQAKHL